MLLKRGEHILRLSDITKICVLSHPFNKLLDFFI